MIVWHCSYERLRKAGNAYRVGHHVLRLWPRKVPVQATTAAGSAIRTGHRRRDRARRPGREETPVQAVDQVHQQLQDHGELRGARGPIAVERRAAAAAARGPFLVRHRRDAPVYGVVDGPEEDQEVLVAGERRQDQPPDVRGPAAAIAAGRL